VRRHLAVVLLAVLVVAPATAASPLTGDEQGMPAQQAASNAGTGPVPPLPGTAEYRAAGPYRLVWAQLNYSAAASVGCQRFGAGAHLAQLADTSNPLGGAAELQAAVMGVEVWIGGGAVSDDMPDGPPAPAFCPSLWYEAARPGSYARRRRACASTLAYVCHVPLATSDGGVGVVVGVDKGDTYAAAVTYTLATRPAPYGSALNGACEEQLGDGFIVAGYGRAVDAGAVRELCASTACWVRGPPRLAKPGAPAWGAIAGDELCPFVFPRTGHAGSGDVHYGPCATHKLFVCVSGGPEPLPPVESFVEDGGGGGSSGGVGQVAALLLSLVGGCVAGAAVWCVCCRARQRGGGLDGADTDAANGAGDLAHKHVALRSYSSAFMTRPPLSPKQQHSRSPLRSRAGRLGELLGAHEPSLKADGGGAGSGGRGAGISTATQELSMVNLLIPAHTSRDSAAPSSADLSDGGAPWLNADAAEGGAVAEPGQPTAVQPVGQGQHPPCSRLAVRAAD